ncbi:hypothetical protein [Actinoplanes sp. G11-F43]|uniref:hypothetical protein n=1 Tax=Actinoplanes sp. G11-F43 TaxID=3424130 RepID=UPI003D32AA2C
MQHGELGRAGGVFEDDRLIAKANQAQRDMWARLEALPRTDGFWAGTDLRTTWSKVDEYAKECHRADPADSTARWARIATTMDACLYSALPLIAEVDEVTGEVVLDLIGVAEWIWLEIGVQPVHQLDDALALIGRPALERLAAREDGPEAERRAAVASLAYWDRRSFDQALGRQEWMVFQMALCNEPDSYWDRLAREQLRADPESVTLLDEAAEWWRVYRDDDYAERRSQLSGAN